MTNKNINKTSAKQHKPRTKLGENIILCVIFTSIHIATELGAILLKLIPSDNIAEFIVLMLPLNIIMIGTLLLTINMYIKYSNKNKKHVDKINNQRN